MEQIPSRAVVRRAQLSLMNPRELDRLLEIVALMEQTLPGDDAIRSYLYHANPTLQGEKPIELLIRGEFDRVAADLQAVQEGVYI